MNMAFDGLEDVSDDALLVLYSNGDATAARVIALRHGPRILALARRMLADNAEAEDVVQDAFVQAYAKLEKFQGSSAFYTWLYRIAFNVSVSRRRKKRPEASVDQNREQTGAEPV